MERITSIQTIEHADGSSHEQLYCFGHLWGPAYFKKGSKDYEEYIAIVKRLAEYEDLEEQGKLLKTPCAVGDTVYKIYPNDLTDRVLGLTVVAFSNKAMELYGDTWTSFDKIGKTVFLTREEAEAALKESGKDKGNETD